MVLRYIINIYKIITLFMPRILSFFVALVLFLGTTPLALAQEEPASPELNIEVGSEATGPLQCFDYYAFGSVQADLQSTLQQTVPGAALYFQGEIVNSNQYPLVDGTLYVKIFKQDEATLAAGNANPVVDQFVIAKNITLPANGTKDTSFEWLVPANAEGGEYYAAYFFSTSDRYNLMGLSFTDDVLGNQASFAVTSDNQPVAKLNKIDTTLNGQTHTYTGFPLHFNTEESVTVTTTITNPTAEAKTMPLQWNQYAWDSLNPDNRRFTKTELVTLAPNETKEVSYNVTSQRESVVYITAITQDNEAKSILNIRYIQDGVQETRINFPGLTNFPLEEGSEATLFACAHSTNEPVVPGNTLTLTLTDKAGNQIHQYHYQGDITAAMSGFGDTFTLSKNYNYALLTTTLEREGVIIEEVQIEYDCEDIDPSSCLPEADQTTSFIDKIMNNPLISFLAIALLLMLLLILFVHRRHGIGPHVTAPKNDMTTPMSILFFLLLMPALFFATGVDKVEAKSVTWSAQTTFDPWSSDYLQTNVTYNATIQNLTTGQPVINGATVTVGDQLQISTAFNNTDIVWYPRDLGEGGTVPYGSMEPRNGFYLANAANPPVTCSVQTKAFIGMSGGTCIGNAFYGSGGPGDGGGYCSGSGTTYYVYTPMSVNPPSVSYSNSGTAAVSCNSSGKCTVTSPGTLNLNVNYLATYGKNSSYRDTYGCLPWYADAPYADGPATQFTISGQTITFNLTAAASNNPPTAPTINGSTNGTFNGIVNTDYYFDFRATDPDGDQITYSIDLDNNGTVDTGSPYGTPVNSGTTQKIHVGKWATPGTYTIKARTNDTNGGMSGWTSHTVIIAAAPAPTATLTINGSAGPLTVAKGTTLNITWGSANAASCSKYGANWGSGQTVSVSGSQSVSSTASDNYIISCGGASDTVAVTVINTPTGMTATPQACGTNQLYLDWNDVSGAASYSVYYSNGTWIGNSTGSNYTFTGTAGQYYSFYVRANSSAGVQSTNSSVFSGTVPAGCIPPATAELDVQVNGGAWINNPAQVTINVGDTVNIGWESTNSTGCTATAGTGFAASGTSGWDPVTPPGSGTYQDFSVSCAGAGGAGTDKVRIITNLAQPNLYPARATNNPGTVDPVTGNYQTIDLIFDIANKGIGNVTTNFGYRLDIDYGADGSFVTNEAAGTITTDIAANDTNGARTTVTMTNFPFGPYILRVIADPPGNGVVSESNEGDNSADFKFTLPPADPGIKIEASRTQVRAGDTVKLTWTAVLNYPMNCVVTGPAGVSVSPATFPGNTMTGPITSKSEFLLSCIEPSTSTTFTDRVIVETVGEVQEI